MIAGLLKGLATLAAMAAVMGYLMVLACEALDAEQRVAERHRHEVARLSGAEVGR